MREECHVSCEKHSYDKLYTMFNEVLHSEGTHLSTINSLEMNPSMCEWENRLQDSSVDSDSLLYSSAVPTS
jgi:hypothetical protein